MQSTDQFEALYHQHAAAILRFAWGLCGNRDQAEDIVSEMFVRVLTRAPKIETQTALAYLSAVARNIFIDGVRRPGREIPLPDQIAARDVDTEDRLDQRSKLAAVVSALATVPEGERP